MHRLLPASIWGCWVCVVGAVIYRQTAMTMSFIQTRIYNPCLKNAHRVVTSDIMGKKCELLIHANGATKPGGEMWKDAEWKIESIFGANIWAFIYRNWVKTKNRLLSVWRQTCKSVHAPLQPFTFLEGCILGWISF